MTARAALPSWLPGALLAVTLGACAPPAPPATKDGGDADDEAAFATDAGARTDGGTTVVDRGAAEDSGAIVVDGGAIEGDGGAADDGGAVDDGGATSAGDGGAGAGNDAGFDQDAVPFPIVGFGRATRGGWQPGREDVVVTSFDDDGPGTLREALRTDGSPRVVTFATSGTIVLASALILPSNVSVDGAGVVVTLLGRGFVVTGSDDVILTHLTLKDVGPDTEDGVQIGSADDPAQRVVLDHLTFTQSGDGGNNGSSKHVDEAVSVVFGARDITIQHCRFVDWEKALLFGNGDVGADVDSAITVTVVRSVFTGTGRRHPQARYGVYDVVNNLMFDWHFFESPYAEPYPQSFGAQIEEGGRLLFDNNVVSRHVHAYDDASFGLSQAHDVTRCRTGGQLDERGTFVRTDNTDAALAFGVGCTAVVVDCPYPLDVATADEALAVELLATAGN